ncbi:MAG: nitroreductase family protein [Chloroflexi bacterium]|nr:nitroreductase family protein [Chloroflexota bacterium]
MVTLQPELCHAAWTPVARCQPVTHNRSVVTELLPAEAVAAVIRSRRSVRVFQPTPLDEATLQALLDLARWAPSPHNSQPWRFVIVRPGPARQRLAAAMAERWQADLTLYREATPAVLRKVETRRQRLLTAPAAIVACLSGEHLDAYADAARRQAEWLTAEHSLGAAVQNLLLAAHSRGLGGCWICAPAFCPETVRHALDLPSDWAPRALVLLGVPAGSGGNPWRRPLCELVVVR